VISRRSREQDSTGSVLVGQPFPVDVRVDLLEFLFTRFP
jgi:hypothetical protein